MRRIFDYDRYPMSVKAKFIAEQIEIELDRISDIAMKRINTTLRILADDNEDVIDKVYEIAGRDFYKNIEKLVIPATIQDYKQYKTLEEMYEDTYIEDAVLMMFEHHLDAYITHLCDDENWYIMPEEEAEED